MCGKNFRSCGWEAERGSGMRRLEEKGLLPNYCFKNEKFAFDLSKIEKNIILSPAGQKSLILFMGTGWCFFW
jgi:hypothetical protein